MDHKKRHSISKSIQNLFHRRQTYSLKPEKNKKQNKFYESINDGCDVTLDPVLSKTGKARVWSVRNSYSKSPIDEFVVEPGNVDANCQRSGKAEKASSDTASHMFDVLSAYQTVSGSIDEELDIENSDNFPIQITDTCTSNESSVYSQDTSDRSRLSSFGSSNCCSDTNHSCSQSSGLDNSYKGPADISTSYWDLQLPESPSPRRFQGTRRFSDSMSCDPKNGNKSLHAKQSLAKRRMSDGPTSVTCCSWQDKVLQSVRNNKVYTTLYADVPEKVDMCSQCQQEGDGHLPRMVCSRKANVNVKRSRSVTVKNHDKTVPLQRSRSADSKLRKAMQKTRERSRIASECQITFSDIESSEESESTEPKDSSESQTVSSNDASSSYSFNSTGEVSNDKKEVGNTHEYTGKLVNVNTEQGFAQSIDSRHTDTALSDAEKLETKPATESHEEQNVAYQTPNVFDIERPDKDQIKASESIEKEVHLVLSKIKVIQKLERTGNNNRPKQDRWLIDFSDDNEMGTDVDKGFQNGDDVDRENGTSKDPTILLENKACEESFPDTAEDGTRENDGGFARESLGVRDDFHEREDNCDKTDNTKTDGGKQYQPFELNEDIVEEITSFGITGTDEMALSVVTSTFVSTAMYTLDNCSEREKENSNNIASSDLAEKCDIVLDVANEIKSMECTPVSLSCESEIGPDTQTTKNDGSSNTDQRSVAELSGDVPTDNAEYDNKLIENENARRDLNVQSVPTHVKVTKYCHEQITTHADGGIQLTDGATQADDVNVNVDHSMTETTRKVTKCDIMLQVDMISLEDEKRGNRSNDNAGQFDELTQIKMDTVQRNENKSKGGKTENCIVYESCDESVQVKDDKSWRGSVDQMIQVDLDSVQKNENKSKGGNYMMYESCDESIQVNDDISWFGTLDEMVQSGENRSWNGTLDDSISMSDTIDEMIQVNDGGRMGFHSMSMEDLLFCSGAGIESEDEIHDVDKVFEAITKEAGKPEYQNKDMMVMFLVGK